MRIVEAVRAFPRQDSWEGLKLLLLITGAAALSAWLTEPFPWYIVAASVCLTLCAWVATTLFCAWRRERRESRFRKKQLRQMDERIDRVRRRQPFSTSDMRKRFVYRDGATGDEVFKYEPN